MVIWHPRRERILHDISLGGLLVVMLVRTVQHNVANAQDPYVYTNCLAALANMAPAFRNIHPHAAQRIVTLIDLLTRKYVQLSCSSLRLPHAVPHATDGQDDKEERQECSDLAVICKAVRDYAPSSGARRFCAHCS